jgi:hypothetical protein
MLYRCYHLLTIEGLSSYLSQGSFAAFSAHALHEADLTSPLQRGKLICFDVIFKQRFFG